MKKKKKKSDDIPWNEST